MTIQSNFPNLSPSLDLNFAATKTLSPLVTFTRASTATYYGTQTAKAEENLVLRSQEFDFAGWIKINATVTANATTAPDGTITADALIENTANSVHNVANSTAYSVSASVYTYSVFVKANGRSIAAINMFDGTNSLTWFDLSSGTVGTNAAGSTANINSVGGGWYRISVTRTLSATSNCYINIYPSTSDGVVTYTGDGTSGIFVWGAQLEQRSAVTAYTATTTQPITNYIPVLQTALAGVPRFDHNPTTFESLGLLVEEQRSNLLTYSSQFDDAAWSKNNCSITANTIVAPDGTLTGDKLVEDTANNNHWLYRNPSYTSGTFYTATAYAKAAERSQVYLQVGGISAFGDLVSAVFDLSTQTVVTTNGSPTTSITAVGNGWYRVSVSKVATATASPQLQIGIASGGSSFYTGDGYSGIYIWGAQLEVGAFPTSYIPSSASQVTRSADAASITGSNFSGFYNQAEGTLYAEYALGAANAGRGIVFVWDGTSNNAITMRYASGSQAQYSVTTNGANQVNLAPSGYSSQGNYKRSIAYKTDSFQQSINGALPSAEDTSGVVPQTNSMFIGSEGSGVVVLCSTIKRLAYYPARLTNAQLQALTS